ncbi:cathelicidin-1-like isoform 2-T2 [Anomaloglossus baeobatrachus]|uniref:cathelicidin-1-like isoform X2 n=1 Tax=Anomaloglossus baeobatrachus TaxID=238106 RepID=UPI003F4F5CC7
MAAWLLSAVLLVAATSQTAGRAMPPGDSQRAAYIAQASALYNAESREDVAYKLLRAPPEDKSRDSENITFIIKETVCSKSARKEQSCPFKTDGVVKICTASLPGQEGRRLDVSCHNMDASVEALQSGENKSSSKAHHILKLLKSGKKKVETNFRQFDKQSVVGSHAVSSCVACIFEMLNQNRNINVSGQ